MIKKICFLLFFVFVFSALVCLAQEKQITNEEYKFRLNFPEGVFSTDDKLTLVEFRGSEKNHGLDAIFFLKRVMPVNISPIEKLETYMKEASTVEAFDKDFIESMKLSFPDIKSLDKSFSNFNNRPAVQGTYTFTMANKSEMKGRYMPLLVKEQSSIYVFSWTSKATMFENWNKAAEETISSLKTY